MPAEGSGAIEASAALGARGRLVTGRLDLAFAADGRGRTYLKRQYAGYPFHVCRALYQDRDLPGLATVYIQSCSGGVYEDDRLDMALAAEEGAEAHVSTQSPTVVHSMPSGHARQRVQIRCEAGSYLEYLPDPQILFPYSRSVSEITIRLCGNGVALVCDAFLSHDPDAGGDTFSAYLAEIVIENAKGEVLAADRLRVDGTTFRDACPGISGAYATQATMIVAGLDFASGALAGELQKIKLDRLEALIGSSHLPNGAGLVVRALALDGAALKRTMHEIWCAARRALKGALPVERRK